MRTTVFVCAFSSHSTPENEFEQFLLRCNVELCSTDAAAQTPFQCILKGFLSAGLPETRCQVSCLWCNPRGLYGGRLEADHLRRFRILMILAGAAGSG